MDINKIASLIWTQGKYVGAGAWAECYSWGAHAFLFVDPQDITKDILCDVSGKSAHLPDITRLGVIRDGRSLFRMKWYRDAKGEPESLLLTNFYGLVYDALEAVDAFPYVDGRRVETTWQKEAMRILPRTLLSQSVQEAICILIEATIPYARKVGFSTFLDTRPGNLGVDGNGNIILRDPVAVVRS